MSVSLVAAAVSRPAQDTHVAAAVPRPAQDTHVAAAVPRPAQDTHVAAAVPRPPQDTHVAAAVEGARARVNGRCIHARKHSFIHSFIHVCVREVTWVSCHVVVLHYGVLFGVGRGSWVDGGKKTYS